MRPDSFVFPERASSTRRAERGTSLIELVLAIAIIAVAMTGTMMIVDTTSRHSAEPMLERQAIALADATLEEVLARPYTDPDDGSVCGTAEARRDGESNERLDRLIVWRFVDDFTDEEKAALAWTEALTELDQSKDLSDIRSTLKRHFSDQQIGALTGLVAQINLWNRIQRSAC